MIPYYSHGISILSEIQFPEFTIKKSAHVDVIIRLGEINSSHKNFKVVYLSNLMKAKIKSNKIHFLWNNIDVFIIKNCEEIIINPQTGLKESFLRLLFLGYVLPILLHLKGRLVLHANAVTMNDGAVVLLGNSGVGKSTISLALHKKGYYLLSDDVLSIKVNGENYQTVYPGFPRIKLFPKVIKKMKENPESMPNINFYNDKRSYNVLDNFFNVKKSLKAIYSIKKGSETVIDQINSHEALMELIRSSYCFKFFEKNELSENLKQCSTVINNVPMKRLKVKHSFKELNNLVEIIENELNDIINY